MTNLSLSDDGRVVITRDGEATILGTADSIQCPCGCETRISALSCAMFIAAKAPSNACVKHARFLTALVGMEIEAPHEIDAALKRLYPTKKPVTPERRREVAKLAAKTRWDAVRKLHKESAEVSDDRGIR